MRRLSQNRLSRQQFSSGEMALIASAIMGSSKRGRSLYPMCASYHAGNRNVAEATGAWRYGKRSAFPTSPHPRRRLRTNVKRGVTLTIHLVQKIGQVTTTTD